MTLSKFRNISLLLENSPLLSFRVWLLRALLILRIPPLVWIYRGIKLESIIYWSKKGR